MPYQGVHRWTAFVVAALLLAGSVVVGALVLLAPGSTPGSGTPTGPSSTSSTATTTAPVTPSGPVSASSLPGANALAVSGSGSGSARFTPSVATWSVRTVYSCPTGSVPFRLVVQDATGATVLTVEGTDSGDERRAVTGPGVFALEISGGCTWSLEATG